HRLDTNPRLVRVFQLQLRNRRSVKVSFQDLYHGYLDVVSGFSLSEKRELFHDTATKIYRLATLGQVDAVR
ncbi:MAG TPA: hypothetical protein VIH54_05105, partial [Chthoniobacterales bacterium]